MSYESLQSELRQYERRNAELTELVLSYQQQVMMLQKNIMTQQDVILRLQGQTSKKLQSSSYEQIIFLDMEVGSHVLQ